MLLRDEEWSKKSDRWIAEKCAVSPQTVSTHRAQVSKLDTSPAADATSAPPREGRDGKSYPTPKAKPKPAEKPEAAPKSKGELAAAFKRLRELPKEEGGTKRKMGRPAKGEGKSASGRGLSGGDSRDEAAASLGIGRGEAEALETVFTTPGVPEARGRAYDLG